MAIDLIENSELTPFESLRTGNHSFLDDRVYESFLGIGEGKQKGKKRAGAVDVDSPNFISQMINLINAFGGVNASNRDYVKQWLTQDPKLVRDVVKSYGVPRDANGLAKLRSAIMFHKDFVLRDNMTCTELEEFVAKLDDEDSANKDAVTRASKKDKKGEEKWRLDFTSNLRKRANNLYTKSKCAEIKQNAESEKATKENLDILNKASAGGDGGQSKITKYIIYGVGGLVLIASVVILLKRK